jgi:hypothetical protein
VHLRRLLLRWSECGCGGAGAGAGAVLRDATAHSVVYSSCLLHHSCSQHLVDMEDEADHREGCHVYGSVEVKRVAGRLHLSVHQSLVFQMLPQLLGSHHIPKVGPARGWGGRGGRWGEAAGGSGQEGAWAAFGRPWPSA